jgi:hypothetical protein
MDKEEFDAWKTSQSTQWVIERLRVRAQALEEAVKGYLYHGTGQAQGEWATMQSRAGHDRGIVTGLNYVVTLEHEEVDASDERSGGQ